MGSDAAHKYQDMGEFTLLSVYCVSITFYAQQRLSLYMSMPPPQDANIEMLAHTSWCLSIAPGL